MSKIVFNTVTYTRAGLYNLKSADLVNLYNTVTGESVKRFSSMEAGVVRTWKALTAHAEAETSAPAPASPVASMGAPVVAANAKPKAKEKAAPKAKAEKAPKAAKAPKATKEPSERRGTNLIPPGHAPLACRQGSKQSILVDKLSRANGATMDELLDALQYGNKPWTEATVRSGFGWDLKQKGYGVRSQFSATGIERFFLVLPEIKGQLASIPAHTPLKGAKPKADARQTKLKA